MVNKKNIALRAIANLDYLKAGLRDEDEGTTEAVRKLMHDVVDASDALKLSLLLSVVEFIAQKVADGEAGTPG